jgi:hypothetical protein
MLWRLDQSHSTDIFGPAKVQLASTLRTGRTLSVELPSKAAPTLILNGLEADHNAHKFNDVDN